MSSLCRIWSLLSVFTIVYAHYQCRTSNGELGICTPFYKCGLRLNSWSNIKSQFRRITYRSRCNDRFSRRTFVCCEYKNWKIPSIPQLVPPQLVPPQPVTPPTPIPSTALPTTTTPLPVKITEPARFSHRNLKLLPPVGKCGDQVMQDFIFGGKITQIDEYPWMAMLEYEKNGKAVGHWCGGMIINERYVLTAAHCIVGKVTKLLGNVFRVRLGEYNTNTTIDCITKAGQMDCADPHQDIMIEDTLAHAEYDGESGGLHNDIAIIRLAKNIKFNDFVKPICLPIDVPRSKPGEKLTVAGWGLNENTIYSIFKRQVDLPVVDNQNCSIIFGRLGKQIIDKQLCAGAEKDRDSCFGDSGGPLMRTFLGSSIYFVEGIVSYGYVCGAQGVPSVNTRVSEYLDWILDRIKPA